MQCNKLVLVNIMYWIYLRDHADGGERNLNFHLINFYLQVFFFCQKPVICFILAFRMFMKYVRKVLLDARPVLTFQNLTVYPRFPRFPSSQVQRKPPSPPLHHHFDVNPPCDAASAASLFPPLSVSRSAPRCELIDVNVIQVQAHGLAKGYKLLHHCHFGFQKVCF